ncbi:hypothetical protein ACWGOQ_0007370 [Aquimarina sp. M1]
MSYSQLTWNKEAKIKYEKYRRDSLSWNQKIFEMDLQNFKNLNKPGGIFPVPKYNLVGDKSFVGLGFDGVNLGVTINDKEFVYYCFFATRNKFNKPFIANLNEDIFFIIAVSTDYIDKKRLTHMEADIISRNHPDYLAAGTCKTKNNVISYTALITGDRNSYAVVNNRIFDLNIGKMILIVPQKDLSLRSMQIQVPTLSLEESKKYVESKLKNDQEVVNFYKCNNCI